VSYLLISISVATIHNYSSTFLFLSFRPSIWIRALWSFPLAGKAFPIYTFHSSTSHCLPIEP
jgi:hypothetical protein